MGEGWLGSLRDPVEFPPLSSPEVDLLDHVASLIKNEVNMLKTNALRGRSREGKTFPSALPLVPCHRACSWFENGDQRSVQPLSHFRQGSECFA